MLELIFQGFVEWGYGLVLECWEYFSSALLDIMSMDFAYLRVHIPVLTEIQQILLSRVSQDAGFCARVADYLVQIGNLDLQHPVSISEGLDWARFLLQSGKTDDTGILDMAPYSIGLLAKDNADRRQILSRIFKVAQ